MATVSPVVHLSALNTCPNALWGVRLAEIGGETLCLAHLLVRAPLPTGSPAAGARSPLPCLPTRTSTTPPQRIPGSIPSRQERSRRDKGNCNLTLLSLHLHHIFTLHLFHSRAASQERMFHRKVLAMTARPGPGFCEILLATTAATLTARASRFKTFGRPPYGHWSLFGHQPARTTSTTPKYCYPGSVPQYFCE
jgi:hypothetical protein